MSELRTIGEIAMDAWRDENEIGWSSKHTATRSLPRPYPRVYEHDVVRDVWGRVGTVVSLDGPWMVVEYDDCKGGTEFWQVRFNGIAEIVWSRP